MKTILGNRRSKPSTAPEDTGGKSDSKPAPKFTPRGSAKKRILLAVENGHIDFKTMGAEASKELNDLMHLPEVQAQFGIGPLTQGFDPRHCKRLYEGIGHVLVGVGRMGFKWPESACEKLKFTDQEKDELAEPTATVLDELAPQWLRENQALAALLLLVTTIMQNKIREAGIEARRVILENQHNAVAPGVAEKMRAAGMRVVPVAPGAGNGAAVTEVIPPASPVNLSPSTGPTL